MLLGGRLVGLKVNCCPTSGCSLAAGGIDWLLSVAAVDCACTVPPDSDVKNPMVISAAIVITIMGVFAEDGFVILFLGAVYNIKNYTN
jgi:hypothetical protein